MYVSMVWHGRVYSMHDAHPTLESHTWYAPDIGELHVTAEHMKGVGNQCPLTQGNKTVLLASHLCVFMSLLASLHLSHRELQPRGSFSLSVHYVCGKKF